MATNSKQHRKRGRPPGKTQDSSVLIRLPADLLAAVDELAEQLGEPRSTVIREALHSHVYSPIWTPKIRKALRPHLDRLIVIYGQ